MPIRAGERQARARAASAPGSTASRRCAVASAARRCTAVSASAAGGDIAVFGAPAPGQAWRAGIGHPWRPGALAAILEGTAAVATSGSYERGPHLLSPFTGQPASRAASATITGPSLALADALATALAVGGDEVLATVAGLGGSGR